MTSNPHPLRDYNEHACFFYGSPPWEGGGTNYGVIPSSKAIGNVLCFENNKLLTKEELLINPSNYINLIVFFLFRLMVVEMSQLLQMTWREIYGNTILGMQRFLLMPLWRNQPLEFPKMLQGLK